MPDTTHAAKIRHLHVQTYGSVYNLGAVLCLQSIKPLFYLTNICRQSYSFLHRIILTTACRLPKRAADWQREITNDSCQVKCGCNPYRIAALALVSQIYFYIIRLHFLYLKFLFSFIFCLQILLNFFRPSTHSAQLSYHPRPDPLSTLFLSTIRPISFANKWPTPLPQFALQYIYHTALFRILFR